MVVSGKDFPNLGWKAYQLFELDESWIWSLIVALEGRFGSFMYSKLLRSPQGSFIMNNLLLVYWTVAQTVAGNRKRSHEEIDGTGTKLWLRVQLGMRRRVRRGILNRAALEKQC